MNRMTFIPGIGLVVVAEAYDPPPVLRYVTANAAKDVTGQYEGPDPRADTPFQSRTVKTGWVDQGLWAVIAVGALALIADGAALWLIR